MNLLEYLHDCDAKGWNYFYSSPLLMDDIATIHNNRVVPDINDRLKITKELNLVLKNYADAMRIKKLEENNPDIPKFMDGEVELTKIITDVIDNVHTDNEITTPQNYVVIGYNENDNMKLLEIATTLPRALSVRKFYRDKKDTEYPLINVYKLMDSDDLIEEELKNYL